MADLEREHISVTEASARGVARLVADAAHGAEVVVTRRGAPVAAVVSVERLAALDELQRDLRDLALVVGRAADDDGRRVALDDVFRAYSTGTGSTGTGSTRTGSTGTRPAGTGSAS